MHRHLLLLALAVLLLADAALGAPVTFDSRFAAVLPAMGQADMGYLPSMMMASFMKKLRHDRPTEAKPEDDGGMAAMATTLGQAGAVLLAAADVRRQPEGADVGPRDPVALLARSIQRAWIAKFHVA